MFLLILKNPSICFFFSLILVSFFILDFYNPIIVSLLLASPQASDAAAADDDFYRSHIYYPIFKTYKFFVLFFFLKPHWILFLCEKNVLKNRVIFSFSGGSCFCNYIPPLFHFSFSSFSLSFFHFIFVFVFPCFKKISNNNKKRKKTTIFHSFFTFNCIFAFRVFFIVVEVVVARMRVVGGGIDWILKDCRCGSEHDPLFLTGRYVDPCPCQISSPSDYPHPSQ